jgi:hypothetical protein
MTAEKTYSMSDLPPRFFDVVPEGCVRQYPFPMISTHNAIWDYADGENGKHYVALCNEFSAANSVVMFEFDPQTKKFAEMFRGDQITMCPKNAIPHSKVHTSICPMRDGRLIMTTHSTSPGPLHDYWLIDSYFYDHWEGFPGSHILIYDPKTKSAHSLGCPTPRDSIYGSIYIEKNHSLYFINYMRGGLFRYDLENQELIELDKITEWATWRLAKDHNENIYTSTRYGHLWKINTSNDTVEDIGQLPGAEIDTNIGRSSHMQLSNFKRGPGGKYYMSWGFSDLLYSYDTDSGVFEALGNMVPPEYRKVQGTHCSTFNFDSQGVLWAGFMMQYGPTGSPIQLFRWDFANDGKPEALGMLGSPERVITNISESWIDTATDTLWLGDTNHADDPPMVCEVNLRKLYAERSLPRPKLRDVLPLWFVRDGEQFYPELYSQAALKKYLEFEKFVQLDYFPFADKEANTRLNRGAGTGVRIWEHVKLGEGHVHQVRFTDNHILRVWCGTLDKVIHCLEVNVNTLAVTETSLAACPLREPVLCAQQLPYRSGRKFLARATASCRFKNGVLYGTEDGLIAAVYDDGKVVSYGALTVMSPVHAMAKSPNSDTIYGVAGKKQDLGLVFAFSPETGMAELGRTHLTLGVAPGNLTCNQPVTLDVAADETLAIGCIDKLGAVFIYKMMQLK